MNYIVKEGDSYYFDDDPVGEHKARLKLEFALEGCDCPLVPSLAVMSATLEDGRRIQFIGDDDNFVEKICYEDDPEKKALDRIGIDVENGIWFFLVGILPEQ